MVFEGDFVEGVIADIDKAKPTTGLQLLPVPVDQRRGQGLRSSAPATRSSCSRTPPATRRFVNYLATPQAAEVWAKTGGFSSPNKNVPAERLHRPDRPAGGASTLANGTTVRFDMSDLAPAAFGGTVGQGEWKIMTDFLKNPSDIKGTQQALEAAAAKAYGK